MRKLFLAAIALSLSVIAYDSLALSEPEAEDIADLTAVFVFLKNDCGYTQLPNDKIKQAIFIFAQQNRFDLSNYNSFNMMKLGEESYDDLSRIAISREKKCSYLAKSTIGLLNNVK